GDFRRKIEDLETRYSDKKRELEQEDGDLSRAISEHSQLGEASERVRGQFRVRKIEIDRESDEIERVINSRIKTGEISGKRIERRKKQSIGSFETTKGNLEKE